MSIQVIRPGLLTSIQDLGRHGLQKHGVIVSGAMDSFALRVANLLVGNAEGEAALEMTLIGPKIQFGEDALIAICGGDLSPNVEGQRIPMWRPVLLKRGTVLSFGAAKSGCRAYLAVAGGFDIPAVMGSFSTYLRAGIGGFQGRALKAGDVLTIRTPSEVSHRKFYRKYSQADSNQTAFSDWSVSREVFPSYQPNPVIRVMHGREFDWFTPGSQEQFFHKEFLVTAQSDRMGYRLSGPQLSLSKPRELISEAVTAGTVQIPSEGNPIVLMADRQTTGGYPKIAQIATVDLPVIAQVKPGEKIRFRPITLEEAHGLIREQEAKFQLLKQGIFLKD